MLKPVAWQSCFFSSSDGYGWSECLCSQSFKKSVTGFGSFPRFRGCRSTKDGAGACGERVGEEPTDMAGAVDVADARPEDVVEEALMG